MPPARIEEPRLRSGDRDHHRQAGRRISQDKAWSHIAGYSCYNDGSVRDWQRHIQWTAGKNFARTGGFGPWMVTADEIPPGAR